MRIIGNVGTRRLFLHLPLEAGEICSLVLCSKARHWLMISTRSQLYIDELYKTKELIFKSW